MNESHIIYCKPPFLKYISFLFIFYSVQITMQNKIQKAIAVSKYIKNHLTSNYIELHI